MRHKGAAMNLSKLIAAHREFGRLMGGRRYEDVSLRGAGVSTSCQPSEPGAPGAHNVIINPKKSVVRARVREGQTGKFAACSVTRGRPRLPCSDPETERKRTTWRKQQARSRARKGASVYQLQITVDAVELSENLLAVGLIDYTEVENRRAIQKAVQDVVNDLSAFVSN